MTTDHTREALAAAYDPDVFDLEVKKSNHSAAQVQWSARRHMAITAAERVLASPWLAAHVAAVVEQSQEHAGAEWSSLRAEVEQLRTRRGDCVCDYNPETTDGPSEDCPQHGRPYSYWVEACDEARAAVDVAVAAERERIAAAIEADDWFNPDDILHHVSDFREGVEYATKRHASIARSTDGGDTDD